MCHRSTDGCRLAQDVPASYPELRARLTAMGASLTIDEEHGFLAAVSYRGEELTTVNAGDDVPHAAVQTDWWRTVWLMQALDQRGLVY